MASLINIIKRENIIDFVPGADITIDDRTLRPYLSPAHKTVATIIGNEVFNAIALQEESDARKYLQSAVANRLMYDYKVFEIIQKRQVQKQDTYKYELESMRETYLNYYYDALDSLIRELNEQPVAGWNDSPAFKTRENLLIKTTAEFESCYGIDGSDFFFFKSIFLQQKALDTHITGIELENLEETLLRRVKRVTAIFTVAYALRQFDYSMLPKTIRNNFAEGAFRHGTSEQNAMYDLSEYLFNQAESELSKVLFEINAPEPGSDVPSSNNMNHPAKKFFLWS